MQFIDAPQPLNIGINQGSFQITNLDEFRRLIDSARVTPEKVDLINAAWEQEFGGKQTTVSQALYAYMKAIEVCTEPPPDWNSTFLFVLLEQNTEQRFYYYTLSTKNGLVSVAAGVPKDVAATGEIHAEAVTFINTIRYFKEKALAGENLSDELTRELAEVTPYVCGSDTCGADACGEVACGLVACATAGCVAVACGAAGCGLAGCGAAGCGAAGCANDACGEAGCGADACYAAGCVAAACPANACAAAACVADLCPANACAADACLVNVIPIVPLY